MKKPHPLTLAPALAPPGKKMPTLTPVQTPQLLPIKSQLQSPRPVKAQQVSVGIVSFCQGGQVAA